MAEQMVVIQKAPSEQEQRAMLARELKALKQNPLDRTVKGGAYTLPDGRVVDAQGKAVKAAATPEMEQAAADGEGAEGGEGESGEDTASATTAKKSTTDTRSSKKKGR